MTAEQIASLGPALVSFLAGFKACFVTNNTFGHLGTYCRGLLSDLARKLKVSPATVRRWSARHWLHCRRSPQHGYQLLWADTDELERLRRLRDHGRTYPKIPTPATLTTPKRRPSKKAKSAGNGTARSRQSKSN